MSYRPPTDEERARRRAAALDRHRIAAPFSHSHRAGRDPVKHRKTKQLPSGAIRSPLGSQITTEDDIADLMREWRGDDA